MSSTYKKIIRDGLWDNNPGIVQVLGLCPLLAVTTSVVNGLGLGLATTFVLVMSHVTRITSYHVCSTRLLRAGRSLPWATARAR